MKAVGSTVKWVNDSGDIGGSSVTWKNGKGWREGRGIEYIGAGSGSWVVKSSIETSGIAYTFS